VITVGLLYYFFQSIRVTLYHVYHFVYHEITLKDTVFYRLYFSTQCIRDRNTHTNDTYGKN